MKKISIILGALVVIILIAGGCVYWFSIRPSHIRKDCSKQAWAPIDNYYSDVNLSQQQLSEFPGIQSTYTTNYNTCLSQHGI